MTISSFLIFTYDDFVRKLPKESSINIAGKTKKRILFIYRDLSFGICRASISRQEFKNEYNDI